MLGVAATDEDMVVLLKRKGRQEKKIARLENKAPSMSLRKLALVEAKDAFAKQVQADFDFAEKGHLKAVARGQDRLNALQEIDNFLHRLHSTAEEKCRELANLHDARAAAKRELSAEVQALIDDKIETLVQGGFETTADTGRRP